MSDQKITMECGLLDKLSSGQDVMADRGFTIGQLEAHGLRLHIPAFLGTHRAQLIATEVTETRRIAEARIHVERAIERIKNVQGLSIISSMLCPISNHLIFACGFLTLVDAPSVPIGGQARCKHVFK